MRLDQLKTLKDWHETHVQYIEKYTWEGVLTIWLAGLFGFPAAWILDQPLLAILGIVIGIWLPDAYVRLRRRWHRKGILRCDWLEAL